MLSMPLVLALFACKGQVESEDKAVLQGQIDDLMNRMEVMEAQFAVRTAELQTAQGDLTKTQEDLALTQEELDATRAALDEAFWAPFAASEVDHLLVYLVLTSPEFALA